ncbi:MAG: hypothetical protein EOP30_04585 [Rhodococcus sp. (in: high G+C Gram-positive bacteria)]|nr:MAG: hypothetical protein EOP30_04585 [Rhodococcus sp. (in: high G+C Gram-positive bacteria)]
MASRGLGGLCRRRFGARRWRGGEFFAVPAAGPQTRYEALRAYLLDGEPAAAVAERFGYTTAGLHSAVADFRAGAKNFFLDARPGPKTAPGKDARPHPDHRPAPRRDTPSTRSPPSWPPRASG